MPTDTAITRLLYAILSQKCLKDIDWNKVAQDPILAQEITNGHAARMRYSRFKKQMDGTTNIPTRKPRKNKVSKSSSASRAPKPRKRSSGSEDGNQSVHNQQEKKFKVERGEPGPSTAAAGESFNSQSTMSSSARDIQTPEPEPGMHSHAPPRIVKPEPGVTLPPYQPNTPLTSFSTPNYTGRYEASASPSPNTSFNNEMFATSFGDPGMMGMGVGGGLYGEMGRGEHHSHVGYGGYGMAGNPVGHHLGFDESLWQQDGHGLVDREGERVSVKSEPRWE